MSIMGEIRNLYIDREKTKVILPRTNTRAVSNDDGVGLEALLAEKADQAASSGAHSCGIYDDDDSCAVGR